MRVKTWAAILVSVAAAVFFVVNWRVFATSTKLDFVVTSVEMPVGAVMMVLFALMIVVLWGYVGNWQSTLLAEFRRQAKELQTQRTLAESAEASRFSELGTLIRDEIAKSDGRLESALELLRTELRDTEHSIAATLGEMDDRLRSLGPSTNVPPSANVQR
ncbi:MAG: Signal transduction histidine kinase [Gammaproteobacteria bacterium]|nr:Signal transduction histidine kinase [Gammaproteobacteria bacterium]